jgi:hypothetical protein
VEKAQIEKQITENELKKPLRMHTIIMFVSPDGAGKSVFSKILFDKLSACFVSYKKAPKISVISYDDIAFDLLGDTAISKHSIEFEYVSEQVEEILFTKLKATTSYPISSDFVILDHSSLSPKFRDKVLKMADEQHYNISAITFDYKDKTEYTNTHGLQLRDMRRTVSGALPVKLYDSIFSIKERQEIGLFDIEISDLKKYDEHILVGDCSEYLIIGDIHGCYDEFVSLIEGEGFVVGPDLRISHPSNKKIILVGDLIDKGRDIPKVIEIAYMNRDILFMVIGNHESFVYRVIKGLLPGTTVTDVMKREYFQTIDLVLIDEVLQEKFFAVVESMREFYIHRDFIVTHAPCDKKYLGKLTSEALKNMRDFKYPKTRDFQHFSEFIYEFDESLEFMKKQASDKQPLHIFGHIVTTEISRFKNKVAIDTGCATGGELTGLYVLAPGRTAIVTEESLTKKKEESKFYKFFE